MDRWQVRQVVNLVNGSTLLGCAVAALGGARLVRGPRGLLVATGYRLPVPVASAFTVGNVITSRHDRAWLDARPALLRHEERHTWQYVACLGLPMVPLYLLAAGWSYLRGGDPAVHNAFERLAGLEDGGYPTTSARVRRRAQPGSTDPRRRERRQTGAMARRPTRRQAGGLSSVGDAASVPGWRRAAGGDRWGPA